MADFEDFAVDMIDDSWDNLSESEDMDFFMVPEEVQDKGVEAIDNFIHNKVMKNIDKDVYNEG